MERWKRQFEYWILFILMLIVAVLSLAGMRNHRIYWLVILVPIGSGFLLMWLYKESRLASIKAFMDHYRIRPVHLWMGVIAVYYLMAVLSNLIL
jgi:maltodextrin utilization protein YvdJ